MKCLFFHIRIFESDLNVEPFFLSGACPDRIQEKKAGSCKVPCVEQATEKEIREKLARKSRKLENTRGDSTRFLVSNSCNSFSKSTKVINPQQSSKKRTRIPNVPHRSFQNYRAEVLIKVDHVPKLSITVLDSLAILHLEKDGSTH